MWSVFCRVGLQRRNNSNIQLINCIWNIYKLQWYLLHWCSLHDYINGACRIETILNHRMKRLTPPEFERVIHPIFEEDETTLILAGGVLGALAGYLQWWVNVLIERKNAPTSPVPSPVNLATVTMSKVSVGSQLKSAGSNLTSTTSKAASSTANSAVRGLCTLIKRVR